MPAQRIGFCRWCPAGNRRVNKRYGDLSTIEERGGQPPDCPLSGQKWQSSSWNCRHEGIFPHAMLVAEMPPFRSAALFPFSPNRAAQPWPYSDPCRGTSFSFARFVLMATLFLCMTVGSLPLFFLLMKRPYGFQAASEIVYTIFVVFFTFARTGTRTGKDLPPCMFTCPAVQPQFSRLLRRHLGFLVVLFALQTAALATRPNLPEWWNIEDRKGATPFHLALILLCFGLGYAQVFTNRSLLDRAHRDFSA
jgi:hypothetical protein